MSASIQARVWHMPRLLHILWAFTRRTAWLPRARTVWTDIRVMGRIVRRGWVRQLGGAAFIARDGMVIHALYVHPTARGQGLGQALLDEAKDSCDRLELWVLVDNAAARAFYAAQGFEEVLCSDGLGNDEQLRDVLMVWEAV